MCLGGLYNLNACDIPDLWPHIGSGKAPPKNWKKLSQRKKGRNLQESNRGGSLSRMDRTIDVMWPKGSITELHKHIQWIWQCMNSSQSAWTTIHETEGGREGEGHGRRHRERSRTNKTGGTKKEAGPMGRKPGKGLDAGSRGYFLRL